MGPGDHRPTGLPSELRVHGTRRCRQVREDKGFRRPEPWPSSSAGYDARAACWEVPQSRRGPWFCGDGPRVPPRPAPTLCGGPEARESRGEQRGRWAGGDAVARETERRGGRSVGAALGTKIRDGDTGARGPGGERDRQGAPRPAQRWRHRQTETRARTETRTETRRDGDARSARATPGPTHAEPRAPAPATHRGRRPRGAG